MNKITKASRFDFLTRAIAMIERYPQWEPRDEPGHYICAHPHYGKITVTLSAWTGEMIYTVFTQVQFPDACGYVRNMSKSGKWNCHLSDPNTVLEFLEDVLSWYEIPDPLIPSIVQENVLKKLGSPRDRKTVNDLVRETSLTIAEADLALTGLETMGYVKSHKRNGDRIYRRL